MLQILHVHHIIDMDLQIKLRFLRRSQLLWAHSAVLHARMILDSATCPPSELGDVLDVLR